MKVEVICHSGYKADERPLRFRSGAREYEVEQVIDQWYGPEDVCFKVQANDGRVYLLRRRQAEPEVEWTLERSRDPGA